MKEYHYDKQQYAFTDHYWTSNFSEEGYNRRACKEGYVLTGLSGGEQVRLEFIVPTAKDYLEAGVAGNTSIVFATEGDENVDVGFNNPNNDVQVCVEKSRR